MLNGRPFCVSFSTSSKVKSSLLRKKVFGLELSAIHRLEKGI